MPEIINLNKFKSLKKENRAIANNTLDRCSVHFSPPNRRSGQQWWAALLHPKASLQSRVETVVQGLTPKPAAEEAGEYEPALSQHSSQQECSGSPEGAVREHRPL